ncbi:RTX toxin, partial [Candidatus Magnetomorum sp. HK-1]
VNDAPVISNISDQTINEGSSFTAISLDNYISDVDNADTEMTWTAKGQTELTLTISDRVATIILPNADWNGSETIIFTASDINGLTDTDTVVFTVMPVNDVPVIADIPDQSIEEGASFTTINLDNYIEDIEDSDTAISWEASGYSQLSVEIVNRAATISPPNINWNGSETIYFTATDSGGLTTADAVIFNITPVNDPPEITDIPDQTIEEGENFVTVQLDNTVSDPDNEDSEMAWAASGQSELSVSISNRIATITVPDENWNGNETILFIAADPNGLTDSDSAVFTVTPVNDPPVITGMTDQSISEGDSFTSIQLDDYVADIENTDTEIIWTATGQSQLTVTIENRIANIILPNNDWNGSETILFTATDTGGLTSNSTVVVTVTPVNDPPQITDIENQNISEGSTFESITLDNNRHIINRHYSKNDCICI